MKWQKFFPLLLLLIPLGSYAQNSSTKSTACISNNEYFPIKKGTALRYLMTVYDERNSRNPQKYPKKYYDVSKIYFGAKPRTIEGVNCKGFMVETVQRKIEIPGQKEELSLLNFIDITYIKKQERVYIGCVPELKNALTEFKEIYTTDVKEVGETFVREETYNGRWLVPSNVSTYYVPELEYNKRGTGRFNSCVIACGALKDESEAIHDGWETRQFSEWAGGELMLYQYYQHHRLFIDTSLQIYGKDYTNLFVTGEDLYKTNSSYEDKKLTTEITNYYAKGIGLVKQVKTEMPTANTGWTFAEEKDWEHTNNKTITILELIPEGLKLPEALITAKANTVPAVSTVPADPNSFEFMAAVKKTVTERYREARQDMTTKGTLPTALVGLWYNRRPDYSSFKTEDHLMLYRFYQNGVYELSFGDVKGTSWGKTQGTWKIIEGQICLLESLNSYQRDYGSFEDLKKIKSLSDIKVVPTQMGAYNILKNAKDKEAIKLQNGSKLAEFEKISEKDYNALLK